MYKCKITQILLKIVGIVLDLKRLFNLFNIAKQIFSFKISILVCKYITIK